MRVIVVGAGVIGAATAWRLRRRGVDVVLCDPTPGMGATHAAGGMLAAISEVQHGQAALYPLMLASAAEYPTFITELAGDSELPTGHETVGTLVLAADRADRDTLALLAEVQHRHGMAVEELSGREVRRLEPAVGPRIAAGFRTPDDHRVDPRQLVRTLLDAALRHDPRRLIIEPVTAVAAQGDGWSVRLESGRAESADKLVLAPGVGLSGIEGLPPQAYAPVRPVFGDVLKVAIPPHLLGPSDTHLLGHTIRGLVHGVPVYLVPRSDGHVVIGATSREDGLAAPSAGGIWRLLRDGGTLVPGLLEAEFVEAVARARPGSPDDIPLIGEVAPGLVLSAGYFRHGILLTALGSRLTADLVCGTTAVDDHDHLAAVDPARLLTTAVGHDRTA
ncbi:glycine oxidase ThiO [Granulicoccus sp. GXG6511]|uniref:glycine oxidase ThiO n=1 Tax=Granulicoccus sp. GXG6511 TaxID=3381351 RepID=UPI003D7E056F